jgi:hypothetical protein
MTLSRAERPVAADRHEPPLVGSYRRLSTVYPELRIHCGVPPRSGQGWIAGADLLQDPAALRELIEFDARAGRREHGVDLRPDVAAGFSLHRYTWPVALAFTLPWFLERRVPRLPIERVSIRRRTGELTVQPLEFACLPDDPAAGSAGAHVAPDETALRAVLLASIAEHLEPLLGVFRKPVRRGPHTFWGMATDAVIEGLWYLGSLLGEEERAAAELTLLLPDAPAAPFTGGACFRHQQGMRTRARVSCCLFYTVRPDEPCFSCPRRK